MRRDVQVRTATAEFRATSAGTIRGYAAVFNADSEPIPGIGIERILPGAFANALKNSDVRALWNHDHRIVLGRERSGTLKVREDKRGLRVEIRPPDSPSGRDALESIRRGDVDQMSFAFWVDRGGFTNSELPNGEPLRLIHEFERIFEVSPVTWPAFPDTEVGAYGARCYQIGGCSTRGRRRTRDDSTDELLALIRAAEEELELDQEAAGDFDAPPRADALSRQLEAEEASLFRGMMAHRDLQRSPAPPESRFAGLSGLELRYELHAMERQIQLEAEAHERQLERVRHGSAHSRRRPTV